MTAIESNRDHVICCGLFNSQRIVAVGAPISLFRQSSSFENLYPFLISFSVPLFDI
jgi:hypothetical protein